MIVCHCAAVSDRRVRELVAGGAQDVLGVATASGAGSFCGGCLPAIADLVTAETGHPVPVSMSTTPRTLPGTAPVRGYKRPQAVVRELQEDLAAGVWRIGWPLPPEAELAERYGVSRGAWREALGLLVHHRSLRQEAGRLVAGAPARWTIAEAAAISLQRSGLTFEHVVDARRTLEAAVARSAARVEVPGKRLEAEDHSGFHLGLAELSGNDVFVLLVDTLIRLTRDLVPDMPAHRTAEAGHAAIVAAVLGRDPEQAAGAMVAHVDALGDAGDPAPEDTGERPRGHDRPAARLARVIAGDIRRRGVEPGAVLGSEPDLARRYEGSTSRLREAVSLLELYGMAYRLPGPAAVVVVARPDHWAVAQLMAQYLDLAQVSAAHIAEARHELELRSVELASARIDQGGAERLRLRLEEELAALTRDSNGYHGYHNIHPMFGELSGNPVIALFTSALVLALLRRVQGRPPRPQRTAARREIAATHAGIVEAVTGGDAQLARARMLDHLRRHSGLGDAAT